MASPKLEAQKREVLGHKVKVLRREGLLPANVYGKGVKSLAVQVKEKDFLQVFKTSGETSLVDLKVSSESKSRPVLIDNVQLAPVTDVPLHVDFHQVSLKEKVRAEVPIELTGSSPALGEKKGILVQQMDEIEVEALPTDLPDKLEADLGELKEVDDAIKVGNLQVDKAKVKIIADAGQIVAKIEPPAEEEVAPPPEEIAVEEAAPEKEAEEEKVEKKAAEEKPDEEKESPEKPTSS